jgi:hypothetical protein
MTTVLVPGRLPAQILTSALVAAVFSNRMLVLSHNNFGYTVPAICLGLMLMVVVDEESAPDPERVVGGLLLIAVLHHYSGLTQVLPIALLWLVLRRGGWRRFPAFLARNPLLIAGAVMFIVTVAVNPEPFTVRLKDVTVGPAEAAAEAAPPDLATKVADNWTYLLHAYPRSYYHQLFVSNGGSWPFVSLPPLGGWIGPIVVGAWVLSACALQRRWWRYVVYFALLSAALLALSVVQHLLTDFYDYRDLTPIFTLLVASLLYVFRATRLGPGLRMAAIAAAVATATFNWVDVAKIDGKTHNSADYAPLSQQTMETLKTDFARRPPRSLGVARVAVVLDAFFPLEPFYLRDLGRYGIPIQPIDAQAYCVDQAAALAAASEDCDAFLLVTHVDRCREEALRDETGPPRVRAYRYGSACDRPDGAGRERVPVALDG